MMPRRPASISTHGVGVGGRFTVFNGWFSHGKAASACRPPRITGNRFGSIVFQNGGRSKEVLLSDEPLEPNVDRLDCW